MNPAKLWSLLCRVGPASIASHCLLCAALFCAPRSASAASLQEVQDFGNNPSRARMFLYVPDKLAASPPVLVAIHYCGGSANAYFSGTGYRALSDQHGFIVIYPQTTSSDGCFDVHSEASLKHDGGGDSASIVSMVRHVIAKRGANPSRVYVTGTSSGAMMTNVLLGAYPDVFQGGAAFAGVPYGCFAGQGAWNSACASGQITKTSQQWGDLARSGYAGYAGPRPRVQLWHGDRDETLNFHNFGEAIKQWTNVLGVSETPSSTEQNAPQSGWTRTRYQDALGIVRVEAVKEAGATHNLSVPAAEVVRFFGLNGASDPGGASVGMTVSDAGTMQALPRADAGASADSGSGASAGDAAPARGPAVGRDGGVARGDATAAGAHDASVSDEHADERAERDERDRAVDDGPDSEGGDDAESDSCSLQSAGTRSRGAATPVILVLLAAALRLRRVRRKPMAQR